MLGVVLVDSVSEKLKQNQDVTWVLSMSAGTMYWKMKEI